MDYAPPTSHFDQSDDILLQLCSTTPYQLQYAIQQDDLLLTPCNGVKDQIKKSDHGQRRKESNSFGFNDDNPSDSKKRKIMHRDIERQRRQEMGALYRTLRSLLPLEYLKGKRSISDHMHEAVKYIKDLKNRIQELGGKRDELQRFSSSSTSSFASECSQSHPPDEDSVTVRTCLAGVEVVVSTNASSKGLPLSRVLRIIIGEGLNIINCITTTINERLIHTIESEMSDGRSIDLCELQQKIMKLTALVLN